MMRRKFTILLFSLLLAVGWTNDATAQARVSHDYSALRAYSQMDKGRMNAPQRANDNYTDMVTLKKTEADLLTYSWSDPETGDSGTDVPATQVATNPYQIYELLRFVYMNPAFPGPSYSAWTSSNLPSLTSYTVRQDPVYYGGIGGGWDIGASCTSVPNNNLVISIPNSTVNFDAIYLIAEGDTLKKWTCVDNGTAIANATGWTVSGTVRQSSQGYNFCYFYNSGSITIPYTQFSSGNYRSVRVIVHAVNDNGASGTISCAGYTQTPDAVASNSTVMASLADWGWTITGTETLAADGTYTPTKEGYTALVVSVKNKNKIFAEPEAYLNSCAFYSKKEVVNWIRDNIESVELLTDGLLIGDQDDYTRGTVFSCDGTYNKFFFLSKGQARKKAAYVNTQISNGTWPSYVGDEVPFRQMFEEFSPTTGESGSETDNFYSKMMEGNVYNVVHDCASVIQNGHQFSMSGNAGEQAYAMVGMNFYIPDFRLALWWTTATIGNYSRQYVDGRDFVPYQYYSNGNWYSSTGGTWSANYAQYNQTYAPKVGLYKITLEATAVPVAQNYVPGNQNYEVTLTWVSSLNQMSGHDVKQIYTVYYWDPETGEQKYVVAEGITDGKTGLTTIKYLVEQFEHSYTIDYIVEGTPDDNDHPQFVAISNVDGVVIPGWSDFVGLELDHHESDFVVADMANWYRNFLAVVNSDPYSGLTVSKITGADGGTPMNSFNLYRWAIKNGVKQPEEKVATLDLSNATTTSVHYKVTYDDDGSNDDLEDQKILAAKYQRATMGIQDEGDIRVKGNGDLVIWPNSYAINFRSITVYNGNNTVASWTYNQSTLPNGWIVSPGSKWEEYNTTTTPSVKVGYMEGGGYIAIPNIMNNSSYNNLRVVIEAFGEAGNVNRITVNDDSKIISATTTGTTYEWTNLSPNALHAPMRATNTDVTFTAGTDAANASTITKNGVTITNTQNTGNNSFSYNPYRLYAGTLDISTTSGTITKIVFNGGNNTSRPVTLLSTSTGNYTTSNNVGTWTGDASSVSFTASGQVRCTSIVVTVKTEDGGGETSMASLTICDDVYRAQPLPVVGYWYDDAQHNQMVYPASMLTDMVGKKIKSMIFYPTSGSVTWNDGTTETSSGGINFSGGSVTFQLANLSSGTAAFAEEDATAITGEMTQVATITPTANGSATTWQITFEQDFVYNGGDLLIDVTNTAGNSGLTFFTVAPTDTRQAMYSFPNESIAYGVDFLPKVTFTYETEAPQAQGGLLRMHLLLCDQLKEEIPNNNKHPEAYGYILRYEPVGGSAKESGSVEVDIEKTDAQPNGYYTKAQIDGDTDAGLTMNILDAQVKMNLNKDNPNVLYYQIQGAPKNTIPNDYLTQLQYIRNAQKYEEMLETSPHKGDQYDPNEVHYYFNDATPEVGKYVNEQGSPDWKAYAPTVSTWGIERRYFEDDGLDNTYGAPIWKTSVGDVQIEGNPALQRQVKSDNDDSPNPYTSWTVDNTVYNLYFLGVNAQGLLPNPEITNIPYEPYMFRVFVASPTGKLRKFDRVMGEGGGYYTVDAGAVAANEKYCVGSFYAGDGWNTSDLLFSKAIPSTNSLRAGGNDNFDPNAWDGIMKFGAVDGITKDDVKVYVRFYYMVEGWNRAAEARPGNGAEGSGDPGNPGTFIYELVGNGEVVGVTYVNAQGMQSSKPFDGLNIVITRYSDGSTITTKVLR